MSNRTFKAGDTVHHKPTGETWSLIRDQQGENVFPGGWPGTMGKASDCEFIAHGSPDLPVRQPVKKPHLQRY